DRPRPCQLQPRVALLLRADKPARGDPHCQRLPRPVEDRPRRHRGPRSAPSAFEAAITKPPARAVSAARADETARPAQPLQVVQAVLVGAEPGLELTR